MGVLDRLRYLAAQLRRSRSHRDLSEELQAHLEFEIEEKMRAGLSRQEALRQTRLEFGSLVAAQESSREASGFALVDAAQQDIRFALRSAIARPGPALVAILTLGLAIGLCTAAFSIVDSYLLRPLPFPESERIMRVRTLPPGAPADLRRTVPPGLRDLDWRVAGPVIEQAVSWDLDVFTVIGDGRPEVLYGAWVPPAHLEMTGVSPVLGRLFSEEDGRPGAAPLAVLSHSVWQRRYGGSPDVVGTRISVFTSDRPDEAEVFSVIGVLPPNFWYFNSYTDFFANLTETRMPYLIRLRSGATPQQAAQYLNDIVRSQLESVDPQWPGFQVAPAQDDYVERVRRSLFVVSGAVALVLLVACANVGLLLTVRALARRHELTIRRALGASRRRVVAQLLTEGLLLALAAGVVGCLVAWWGVENLSGLIESQLAVTAPGGAESIRLEPLGLLLALLLSTLTGLLFTLAPVAAATGADLISSLSDGGRTVAGSLSGLWGRRLVIGAEIAVSLVLLVSAGLMIQTSSHLSRMDLGFEPENVLTAALSLRARDYTEPHRITTLSDHVLERIRQTPGVLSATMTSGWPFGDRHGGPVVAADAGSPDSAPSGVLYIVATDYFETMGVPLLAGRAFDSDRADSPPTVIISESLAGQLWPGREALGRELRLGAEGRNAPLRTVVGVAVDVRETLLGEVLPDTYVPLTQAPGIYLSLAARMAGSPDTIVATLHEAVAELDPNAAVTSVMPMIELVDRQRVRPQFLAGLLTAFSLFALTLTVVGLYSIIAFAVAQKRRDVAIHMALGARGPSVIGLFVRQTVWTLLVGLGLGLAGGVALSRTLESQLHGVTPLDPVSWAGAVVLLLGAALAAITLPAWRATDTDPAMVLRQE